MVGLDPDRLYPSIYLDDEEAFKIWNKEIGVPAERIFRFRQERITSGSTAQAPAAPVPRSTMTGEKSTAAESRTVP